MGLDLLGVVRLADRRDALHGVSKVLHTRGRVIAVVQQISKHTQHCQDQNDHTAQYRREHDQKA
jgi:hypothetical protein